jgi:beta-glucosidase
MSRSYSSISYLAAFFMLVCCTRIEALERADLNERVEEILSAMTLDEKVGQLNQYDVGESDLKKAIAEGKVGSVLNAVGAALTDELQRIAVERSPHHIPILFAFDVIHGLRTIFPIPLGLASTWDPESIETMARISAEEAGESGVRMTFSPMVDVARDPRWGRIAEGSGEDKTLGSIMARAYVRGYQGVDLSAPTSIAACVKHYVGYGAAEGGRDYNTVDMSEGRLREIYLPPFKAAVDSGAVAVMSAFNTLNGVPASANDHTLRDILKGEWKFPGLVISDMYSIRELMPHGVATDAKDAARKALLAGVDIDMASGVYLDHAAALVRGGVISLSMIDDAVRRILRVKFQLGLFERPYVGDERDANKSLTAEKRASTRAIAQKSIVLLRNEGSLLPLSKSVGPIAVIGPLADSKPVMLGNWLGKGNADEAVSVIEGIRSKGRDIVLFNKGGDILNDAIDGIDSAVEVARKANVVIMVLGENVDMSGEAASRANLNLPGQQEKLLEAVVATGKPVVLVLMSGRPLSIAWASTHVPAILEAWFPGSEGGNAIADIIFGDSNPSARLPVSIPRSAEQVPIYYDHLSTGRPTGANTRYQTGYLDLEISPLYPFGYGLSYSDFEYRDLHAEVLLSGDDKVKVSVDVTNISQHAGDEVVQLYIREPASTIARPVIQLKDFKRIRLNPGETRNAIFDLNFNQLRALQPDMSFVVNPGIYRVGVGSNSAKLLEAPFEISPSGAIAREK